MKGTDTIAAALVDVLNTPSTRPSGLSCVKYKREIQPEVLPNGDIKVALSRIGYEYKRRYPRPKTPLAVDLNEVHRTISRALSPQYAIRKIDLEQSQITLYICRRTKNELY